MDDIAYRGLTGSEQAAYHLCLKYYGSDVAGCLLDARGAPAWFIDEVRRDLRLAREPSTRARLGETVVREIEDLLHQITEGVS